MISTMFSHWNKATVHAIDWGPHPVGFRWTSRLFWPRFEKTAEAPDGAARCAAARDRTPAAPGPEAARICIGLHVIAITHRIHVWICMVYMLTWLGYIDGKCYHIYIYGIHTDPMGNGIVPNGIGGFHKWGYTFKWMVYFMENPI